MENKEEKMTIGTGDVGTLAVGKDNPFGTPGTESDDDLFSVDVPVDTGYRVKAGKQPLKLIALSKAISNNKNPMWIWEFVILIGPDAGKTLKMWTALTAAAMWKLREVLAAFGIAGAEGGAQAKFKRTDVINKFVMGDVVDDSYEGRPNSKIDKIYPVSAEDVPRIEAAAKATAAGSKTPF